MEPNNLSHLAQENHYLSPYDRPAAVPSIAVYGGSSRCPLVIGTALAAKEQLGHRGKRLADCSIFATRAAYQLSLDSASLY
jgi:hypothetical protein